MDGAAIAIAIAIATDDTFQVIAAEGENSAAQALRNASEVNFDFCHNQTAGGFFLGPDSHLHLPSQSLKSLATGHLWQPSSYAAALFAGTTQANQKNKRKNSDSIIFESESSYMVQCGVMIFLGSNSFVPLK